MFSDKYLLFFFNEADGLNIKNKCKFGTVDDP